MGDDTGQASATGARIVDIGPHRVAVGDVERGAVAEVMAGERADVIYSDPPWGPGLLQIFATMRERGSVPVSPWLVFVETWARAAADALRPGGALFVEMGFAWEAGLRVALDRVGLPVRYRWETTYRTGAKPLRAALFYSGPELRGDFNPAPLRGPALPRACVAEGVRVLGIERGGIVLDPCCGKGLTARAAVAAKMRFRGVELVPSRAEVTIALLRGAR